MTIRPDLLPPKKHAGAVGLDRFPSPVSQAPTGWDTYPALLAPSLCSSTRKKNVRHGKLAEAPRNQWYYADPFQNPYQSKLT